MDASGLDPDSYTAQRLQHATPEHLYLTSRRCFVGPIPEGWLKSYRRDWYKHHLHINYSSRAATFSAGALVSHHRRVTGLETPRTSAEIPASFPQPADLAAEDTEYEDVEPGKGAAVDVPGPAAVVAPRAEHADNAIVDESLEEQGKTQDSSPSTKRDRRMSQKDPAHKGKLAGSFFTASEGAASQPNTDMRAISRGGSSLQPPPGSPRGDASTSSLLPKADSGPAAAVHFKPMRRANTMPTRGVTFAVPEEPKRSQLQAKARLTQMSLRRAGSRTKTRKPQEGQIIKMEKMLVRVESTMADLGDDFDENVARGIDARTTEKWREYMVVCRDSTEDDAQFVLQMYKTRVIPGVEQQKTKKKPKHEIFLSRKSIKVNLYSSLDKSVVIWGPWRQSTRILLMRPRSGSDAVEWYTFLRNILGWHRARELQINVPDLNVSVRLDNPFQQLEESTDLERIEDGSEDAITRSAIEEELVAQNIINRTLDLLKKSGEYGNIVRPWAESGRVGLAWKRYDRLEWIHGDNERKMYGTIAMAKTHELELRPKQHYPTTATDDEDAKLREPVPVEGFLIRLTSQRGVDKRLGRMFFKRLYFSTHDNFLVFSRPARANPPPPPKLPSSRGSRIPSAKQIAEGIPIVYAVNPYPIKNGEIEWLAAGNRGLPEDINHHDQDARDEAERKTDLLLKCDGYINLCNVTKIRNVQRGATAVDEDIESGSDVDFDREVADTMQDDGVTKEFDDERTFELVLKNGLLIRLQAYNKLTKNEWMRRLRDLVKYWKYRSTSDIELTKSVRRRNLALLNIDEEAEALVGQFARKWEVLHTHASPDLYNLCGISNCRTVHHQIAGTLYRKPRRHGTFTRCSVILSSGKLLVFQDSLRKATGKQISHIHNEHTATIDLRDCYLYSGLVTENDLLYQNRTFDNNRPGHTALPRIYLEDGWTSTDEDSMTCFVIWHAARRSLFRREKLHSPEDKERDPARKTRFKWVSQLGVPGNTMVFKARSRAERDHWVLAIQTEIEKMGDMDEVRITGVD
ncbi:uncharacterized protein K452DRAFT_280496 [Aplosporella prunicola CBS 121167]|uniref:PH domain-containing protein n=1 Tax=Aplosporella prunicola CBS 121167 TaxID=1176127 RepID=A0A6A6AY57_9PEZI|nr:uncharacterized protein K452DRAFT_280496 [Aplosporella prunicola CBS 121167]KAF2136103.1 hypothetical protein K452DRAFT_280496 [Aplosporella prunicola CBS 121167]